MKRLVALASGRGSNFRAVAEAVRDRSLDGELVGLIVDRTQTGAASIAREFGVPVFELPYRSFAQRSDYDSAFARTLAELKPDVVLALGYLRILEARVVERYRGRLINIHPSLLPAFPGLAAQKQAYEYGVRITGCTAHYVDEGVDTGPVILQAAVVVQPQWTLSQLEEEILEEEHRVLVEAVRLHCAGRLRIEGRRVLISGNG